MIERVGWKYKYSLEVIDIRSPNLNKMTKEEMRVQK